MKAQICQADGKNRQSFILINECITALDSKDVVECGWSSLDQVSGRLAPADYNIHRFLMIESR